MTYPSQSASPQPAAGDRSAWPHQRPGGSSRSLPPPPSVAPSGERLAEFTDRLLAYLVDSAILFLVGVILELPLLVYFIAVANDVTASRAPDAATIVLQVLGLTAVTIALSLIATYLYEVEMMYRRGQTVGKRILKIRVTTLDGSPLTRALAAKRWLAYSVAGAFIPAYSWLDGLWQLWDKPYRQCLHDKFATTVVVTGKPTRGVA